MPGNRGEAHAERLGERRHRGLALNREPRQYCPARWIRQRIEQRRQTVWRHLGTYLTVMLNITALDKTQQRKTQRRKTHNSKVTNGQPEVVTYRLTPVLTALTATYSD